jgi:alpha-L-rhamnosidase
MGLQGQVRAQSADGKALSRHGFTAEMIAPACDQGTGGPGCYVAGDFSVEKVEAGSVLHLSAQGLYRAFLNGVRVGDDLLTPGWTCYDDRIAYQSYDVTPLLKPGQNRLEIWLGDGWYRSRLMWALNPIPNTWGDRTGAFAELVAGGQDGPEDRWDVEVGVHAGDGQRHLPRRRLRRPDHPCRYTWRRGPALRPRPARPA